MLTFPKPLLEELKSIAGFDVNAFLAAHAPEKNITSIRLNPFKHTKLDFELNKSVPWHNQGYYLADRPYFTHDPLFHAGIYYVQEAASMFLKQALSQAVDLQQDLNILDISAAPGGKSTLINAMITNNSLLVANEIVKSRADVLAQNLSRWGTTNTIVTNNAPDKFTQLEQFFDVLVVDAPCSGSGLFRKQAEAINEWSEQAVQACSLRQKNILETLIPVMKNNGTIIYSTCSYSFEENEKIVQWLIKTYDLEFFPLEIDANWGIEQSEFGYRFYPHLTDAEGFFCAVLKKRTNHNFHNRPLNIKPFITKAEIAEVQKFIAPNHCLSHKINQRLHLMSENVLGFFQKYEKSFYYKKAGTLIGEIKNNTLIPEQELAWSIYLNKNIQQLDLELSEAIKYLKKENFQIPNNIGGLCLFTYKKNGLGWGKVLSNRINNYLPNEIKVLR